MQFEQRPSGLLVPSAALLLGGYFIGQHIRDGDVIEEWEDHNLVTNQGLDDILGVYLTGVAQTNSWYIAPFKGNYAPVATDTAQSMPGNANESTEYTASSRLPYTATEANQSATNSAQPATFTFNATVTIYGAFLISSGGKQATSGKLFAASQFTTPKNVANNDQLSLTYVVNAQAA